MDNQHITISGAREKAALPSQCWDCPRELTPSEKLALQHFRTFLAAPVSSQRTSSSQQQTVMEEDSRTRAPRDPVASLVRLRFALQQQELQCSKQRIKAPAQ